MRIFVNNVDSYVGKALCADLRQVVDKENRIIGTMMGDEDEAWWLAEKSETQGGYAVDTERPQQQVNMELLETMGVKRIVSRKERREHLKDILSCSLIVFDLHSSSLEEVEQVIRQLKIAKLDRNVVFVLVSSVSVWAKTKINREPIQADDEEEDAQDEDEGAPPKIVKTKPEMLADTNLDKRTSETASVYEAWKYLENLTLSLSSRDKLRPHVVGAGILYGNGETTFNELFKEAWLTRPTHSIIEPGDNYIPCVHVRDVARLVRVVVQDDAVGPYLIAVDKAQLTQGMIVEGIVNTMSTKRSLPLRSADEVDNEFKDAMTLDLIMQPSAPMRSKDFPWWCKTGLVDNMSKVAKEFCKWRNLRPIKMIIIGPPGSGGEKFSDLVADRYLHEDPPLLSFDKIVQEALDATGADGQPTKAARVLRRKLKKANKKPGGKLPLKIRTKLVRDRLLSNVCRFRGYVLEGYPQSAAEAEALFTEEVPDDPEAPVEDPLDEEEVEGEGDDAEDADDAEEEPPQEAADDADEDETEPPKRIVSESIVPEFVVVLSSDMERCKERIFSGLAKGANSEDEFVRRCQEYSTQNLAQDGRLATCDFFEETASVKVLHADVDKNDEAEVFRAIRVYMESRGQFFNYLKSEEDRIRDVAAEIAERELLDDKQRAAEVAERKAKEEYRRAERAKGEASRLRMLADSEEQLLRNEATPLQKYLETNVVPTLTEGLMEVCKVMPDDPIEYLSEYLFAHAQNIQQQLQEDN
jgi:adenylate kinase